MFIDVVPNGRSAPAVLLRESYREGKRVLKRTLANLSGLPPPLIDVAAAISANRTLAGAVEWSQPGGASFEDVEFEGAAAARAAAIPVTLWFTVAGSPLA